jgi:multidrug efflux pump subunit AcrA (membrane-fusion protein)
MKRARVIVPIAAVVFFFFGGWALRNKLAADRQGDWVEATRGDVVTGVDVSGTLAAIDSSVLGPPQIPDTWEFKVSMMAPEGSDVKKGTPVLGFDTSELQRRLDQYRALAEQAAKEIEKKRSDLALHRETDRIALAEAEARLRKTALKLDAPADIVGIKEREEVQLDYETSKREVTSIRDRLAAFERAAAAQIRLLESKRAQAEAVVHDSEAAIKAMMVVAPRDGTVVYATDWKGDKRKVGDSCWRGQRVVEIPNLNKMKAKGEVDEVDAGKIAVGERVTFRLDSHPDDELHGTITQAARTVQQQSGTKNPVKVLNVDVAIDKTDPAKMRPGMRFQGTVELARSRNAVVIPRNAVFVSAKGPIAYRRGVFGVTQVPVKLGRENDKLVEVVSGLASGDRVLVEKNEKAETKS